MTFNYDARTLRKNATNQILSDLVRQPSQSNFFRAVVVEVLNDPNEKLGIEVTNKNYVRSFPRNSIVAKIISNSSAKSSDSNIICYPFFPQHLSLPVNPGEQVWLMTDTAGGESSLFYWMCRITEPDHVDDLNYTHSDRKFERNNNISTANRLETIKNPTIKKPGFQNGAGTDDSSTINGGSDAFDKIVNVSASFLKAVKEAIPRFTKRPGDHVIQGSNNTLIWLGIERPNAIADSSSANKIDNESNKNRGCIDIVAGRGQGTSSIDKIENTRGFEENDKKKTKVQEGDPDYVNDLSRFYVTMNSEFDEKFDISSFKNDQKSGAAAVVKSDHIRIVARENGTIRISKPGNNNGFIQIEQDGSIFLAGKKIVVESQQIELGENSTETTILADTFLSSLNVLLSSITVSIDSYASSGAAIGPALLQLTALKASIESFKSQIQLFKSTKVKIT
jgi:hypothetical protein